MLEYKEGNIFHIAEGIIVHQVNCKGVCGAGLAKQIADRYPRWEEGYKRFCKSTTEEKLGYCLFYPETPMGAAKIVIASLFAQNGYGRNKRYTNYIHFAQALVSLKEHIKDYEGMMCKKYKLYFPYGIGCGLGGGDWTIIETLIEDIFPKAIIIMKSKGRITSCSDPKWMELKNHIIKTQKDMLEN